MAIKINFYTYSKRVNSTAIPSGTGTEYDATIKQPCSIINPVIEINAMQTASPAFNYCHIADFERWYWVSNWTWERGLWIADLTIDPLASWRTEIGASSNYIVRSASNYNLNITDNYWPTVNDAAITTNFTIKTGSTYPFSALDVASLGCYVLGVINNAADTLNCSNSISYYVLTYNEMRNLTKYMLGDISYMNIQDIGAELAKGIINPFDYIVSCIWLPMDYTQIASQTSVVIKAGWWTPTDGNGYILGHQLSSAAFTRAYTFNMDVPKHPQASTYGAYLNAAPYAQYYVTVGPWGTIPIDPQLIYSASYLRFDIELDVISGQAVLYFGNSAGMKKSAAHFAQVGVPIQLSQIGIDTLGAASGILSAAGNAVMDVARGNYAGALAGVVSAVDAAMPEPASSGSQGSYCGTAQLPEIIGKFYSISGKDITHRGAPLCQVATINTLSGYVLVDDPEISAPATAAEMELIRNYMAGGFYYE